MKYIFLIFIILSINGISKGQNCNSIIDIYGQIGSKLPLNANFNIAPNHIIHEHWEWNDSIISFDNVYTIDSLSLENGGTYVYEVEYYSSEIGTNVQALFCFQVYANELLEENYPKNEIIIDIEDMSSSDIITLNYYLDSLGFVKIDSCLCNTLELWAIDADMPELELASTIKEAGDKIDKDDGKSSRNYFANPDVPLYCMEGDQYKWLSLPPSSLQNNAIVNVAILDNGFNPSMFPNHLWTGTASMNFCCSNNGNGDPNGYNALEECNMVVPEDHGTTVASIMASFSPDNIPYQMMNMKAIDQRKGSLFKVACAAKYAMRSGADIINFSMGYYGEKFDLLDDLINEARDSQVLVIASAGNGGQERNNHWPSNYSNPIYGYDNVISVGATNYLGQQANFSSNADIYAPGHNLISNGLANVHTLKSGTSFSTAFVTAAAASCLSENPNLNPNEVIEMLINPDLDWSSEQSGLIELNVDLIIESDPIPFQEHLIINETISIKRVFDAKRVIKSSATLLDGADVSMRTGDSILFQAGFKSVPGSILLATVKDCDEYPSARFVQDEIDEPESLIIKDGFSNQNDKLIVVPNPFHGQTTISFNLEEEGFIELSIYSSLGQKIRTLARGQYHKGSFDVIFYAKDIPFGVYYVNLIKGKILITEKIVLQ